LAKAEAALEELGVAKGGWNSRASA
jgi:hypothetical protein